MTRVSSPVLVLLLFAVVAVVEVNSWTGLMRNRAKRRFCPVPESLPENKDITKYWFLRTGPPRNDKPKVKYSLKGIGADQPPINLFVIDPDTGSVRVTGILDRETTEKYELTIFVAYADGSVRDSFGLYVVVEDENDNSPEFGTIEPGMVNELSPAGTFVMKVTAHDADKPWDWNSKIAYSIVEQVPPEDMFNITKDGDIYVSRPSLDRERCDMYILTVKGQDRYGAPDGNTGTGTVTIYVQDVNDNLPTLEKEGYEGSIDENTEGVEVMRIQAEDRDLKDTENWEVVFDIVKGNEAGYFSITTDPQTNEGILMLDKAVNYEDVKHFQLEVVVRNKAKPYTSTDAGVVDGRAGRFRRSGVGTEDKPSKTVTGTIVIHLEVEDLNDNCPTLTSNIQTMCTTADAVTVTAKDEDTFSNAPPFIFSIVPDGTRGKWNVEYLNETSAILRAQEDMWPGSYEVTLEVRDQQGDSCPDLQRVKVEVCTCEDGKVCRERRSKSSRERVKVTPLLVGLIILGLLLLLIMLLLIYSCRRFWSLRGGFTKLPSEIKSHVLA